MMAKFKRLVMTVLCLSLSALISGENGDLGVLADLESAGNYQEPLFPGQKDRSQAKFSTTQQLPEFPQSDVQSTVAARDVSKPIVHPTVTSNVHLQTDSSDGREGSQQNVTDAIDGSVMETKILSDSQTDMRVPPYSLADQDNSVIKDTKIEDTVKPGSDLGKSDSFAEFGSKPNQHEIENDEPSKLNEPDSVRLILSDIGLKSKEESENDTVGNSSMNYSRDSQNKPIQDKSNDEDLEDDRSYGNPPILLDSNTLDTLKKISDLSPEKREQLRTELSEKLGLSAVDPGLAMLPMKQNFQASSSEATSVPSTYSTIESSKFPKEGSILNIISNIVKSDLGQESQANSDVKTDPVDDFEVAESKYENKENYRRKVLNENDMENGGKEDDEYEFNVDKYFYDYYDEDEDDYVGGEVLGIVSPNDDKEAGVTMEQTGDEAKKKMELTGDNSANSAEFNFKEEQPPGSDRTKQPGEFNIQHVFNYDEDDDHWYYDPGDTEDDVRLLPAPLVPTTSNDIPSKDKVDGSNSSTSEFKSEKGVADLKEGVVNKGGLPTKKVLQAPKGTIVLYTVIIVVFIAGIVLFSVWKNPFQDGRPRHPPPVIRVGEEGKRLLDHPFV
ncbi:uncharacterized protein LOC143285517 isoform X1 [Babylonia areolata]|uniref:uncharacterized protein LOC143285517 isoform X1 n=1 Tax=Babylonia areolata TaxID=304850 RepID=UPI003FCEF152